MVTVLYVDDEPDLLELGKIFLEQTFGFQVDILTSATDALESGRFSSYDIIISDYQMPGMNGIDFLKAVRESHETLPFILFTGRGREEIVIEAINNGADFYLQKGGDTKAQFAELDHKIRQAVARRDAERALIESEKRLREAQEMAHLGFWVWDIKTGAVEWSEEVYRIYGKDPRTFTPRIDAILALSPWPGNHDRDKELIRLATNSQKKGSFDQRFLRPDASIGYCHSTFEGRYDPQGNLETIIGTVVDITDRKLADDALRESEDKFRQLLTQAPIPFSVSNCNGKIEFINTRFTQLFGYTLEDIPTIRDWFRQACPDAQSEIRASEIWDSIVRRANEDGTTMGPVEYDITCRDGSIRNVILSGIAIRGKLLAAFIDITERKRTEAALQKNREQYQELVEHANSIILKMDREGIITFFNEFAQRFFGYSSEEIIGKNVIGTIVPVTESRSDRDLIEMIENILRYPEKYVHNENENTRKDGTRIWVQWHNKPLIDDNGQYCGMFCIGTDVTERRKTEQTLQRAHDELERRVRERTSALRESEERLKLKLDSLLSCDSDSSDIELINVLDISDIQSMMRDFSLLSGMPTAILDLKGNVIEANGWQDICRKFHRANEKATRLCRESDQILTGNLKEGEYLAHRCSNNLWDVATPLYIGGRHVANIFTGQFFSDDETVDESFVALRAEEFGFDREEYLAALRRVPRFTHDQIHHLMDFLVKLTRFISRLSYANLKLAKTMADEQQSREALIQSERRLAEIIEHLPDATLAIDREGKVIAWNKSMTEMTGIKSEDILGKGDYEYALPFYGYRRPILIDWIFRRHEDLETKYTIRKREGDVIVAEVDIELPDGRNVTHWGKATALFDNEGNNIGAIESIRDITDRKKAETELHALYNELEKRVIERTQELSKAHGASRQANEKLNLLSGITRHDISNQLMVLSGYLELSKKTLADPERTASFIATEEKIVGTIAHQIRFTKDYEDMGVKAPAWHNVVNVAGRAGATLQMHNIRIDFGDPGLEIFADPLLEKVFYNLTDNALRYGGEKMTAIQMSHREDNGNLILSVEDDGDGIKPEEKQKIFRKGFGRNTGLGLFLTREILAITGITIIENGTPGEGSRFEITVPHGSYRYTQPGKK